MNNITERIFGSFNGIPVIEYTISNEQGMSVSVMSYGATVTSLMTRDREGRFENVIVGYEKFEGYLSKDNPYNGAIIGRYANRIANGMFRIDGTAYFLAKNNNNNSLHGGIKGFDKVIWNIQKDEEGKSLHCTYRSIDGEEGYPGNLDVTVIYTLTPGNGLMIGYTAISDKPTPVNLTNHAYFNLSGNRHASIMEHELQLFADEYTEVTPDLIPTGRLIPVKGSPFDFTSPKKIGRDFNSAGVYDHNFILNHSQKDQDLNLPIAARLHDSVSGRSMEMLTTEPAVQFYSGNISKDDPQQPGLCLEAQHYPNSPNEPSFPGTILQPGDTYRQTTVYTFTAL